MNQSGERRWSSKLMFLAAAIGSVVGISNVWKFTYVAGENGGGAFVIVYIAAIAFIALPALIAEFLVGRRGGASVVKTMDVLASREGISPLWRWYGVMGALGAFIALSFYAVVAGWTVDYFYQSLVHGFAGITAEQSSHALGDLLGNPGRMLVGHTLFLLLTVATVAGGVRQGLERALKYLTPTLLAILLSLLVFAFFVGDMKAGASFLFVPDFAKLDMQVVLMAVGQAFFSLGIGLGVLLTIGAYMDRSTSIVRASIVVAAADGLVALIAGLAIFPIVFAHDLSPAEGPGLIFATLPVAFGQMPAGAWLGPLFFILMAVAALTSAITILETVVAAVEDYSGRSRRTIAVTVGLLLWVVGLGTVFSFNLLADYRPLGFLPAFADRTIFESLDYVVSNFMMPAGGMLIAILAGWGLGKVVTRDELGVTDGPWFRLWLFLVRVLVPAAIAMVFISII